MRGATIGKDISPPASWPLLSTPPPSERRPDHLARRQRPAPRRLGVPLILLVAGRMRRWMIRGHGISIIRRARASDLNPTITPVLLPHRAATAQPLAAPPAGAHVGGLVGQGRPGARRVHHQGERMALLHLLPRPPSMCEMPSLSSEVILELHRPSQPPCIPPPRCSRGSGRM